MTNTFRPAQSDDDGDGVSQVEIAEVMTGSPQAAVEFIEDHPELTEAQLAQLRDHAMSSGPAWESVVTAASGAAPARVDGEVDPPSAPTFEEDVADASYEDQVAQARELIEAEIADWQERNGTSQVPRLHLQQAVRDSGLPNPEQLAEDAMSQIEADNADDDDDGDGDPDDAGEGVVDVSLPEWVLQSGLSLNGGSPLTPEQEQRIVEYWNLYRGGEYDSIQDIAAFLEDPSKENQLLIEAAVLDDAPEQGWTVQMPGGRPSVVISGRLAANLFENYGFDMSGLNRMARLVGMQDQTMLPFDDPADNLLIIAGIMSGLGLNDELSAAEEAMGDSQNEQRAILEGRERAAQMRPRGTGMFHEMEQATPRDTGLRASPGMETQFGGRVAGMLDQRYEDHPDQAAGWIRQNWPQLGPEDRAAVSAWLHNHPGVTLLVSNLPGMNKDVSVRRGRWTGATDPATSATVSVQLAQHRFRQGMERYQDVGLAMVHSIDQGLAARVAHTGGDPAKLSPEDELRVWNVIRRTSGEQAESWLDLAPDSPLSLFRAFSKERLGETAGAGRVRTILDQTAVKQEFARMMQATLLIDPSDEMQNQFAKEMQAQVDAAAEGQQIDVGARIQAWIQGQARYEELYGNKPAGLSDEEYMGMHRTAESDMLGGEAAPVEALESGMRSGKYQSTIGAIAGTKVAFGNSRFLGRLAEAAQTFQSNT